MINNQTHNDKNRKLQIIFVNAILGLTVISFLMLAMIDVVLTMVYIGGFLTAIMNMLLFMLITGTGKPQHTDK